MNSILKFVFLIVALILFYACSNSKSLFEEDQSEWFISGEATWGLENGELVGSITNGTGFIMTNTQFEDFVLSMDFKPDSSINSGVFIRCQHKEISSSTCYEINIWDLNPNQDYRTGGVVSIAKPLNYVETINTWNTFRIKMVKQHLQVWINDVLTTDIHDKALRRGYIGLQAQDDGFIKFRKIRIKEYREF
ncbi:DUF1080 domain-containing protein [Arenibacter sp. GZD96]|uniref:3-keto-disaccharide hydrolase n=1 Tax=Aurantibrevibacter litoralis TaxID=3106030 RepID=UPI002B0011DB|nr:DUF1080 domain-containing protein [Arenibacter sp. GZD-96]MEA1786975.1 DUF1080 domain-containing protein [Arenibacter sp. GZD-96]